MHHRFDVCARLIDLAVDEPLEVELAVPRIHGVAVEIELDDVLRGDQLGRQRARKQIPVRVFVVTHADVPVTIDDTFFVQDMVGRDQIFDQRRIRGSC